MHMALKTFLLASILSLAAAKGFKASVFSYPATKQAAFQNFIVQESLASVPPGFTQVGAAAAASLVNLRIGLSSKDTAGLEKALLDVSHPSSAKYGKHLTKAEVNAFIAPSDAAVKAVQKWLSSHGLVGTPSSSTGHWLSVSVPVSKANTMLSANYQTYEYVASGKTYARTLAFSLPSEVADFIDHIHPTTAFNNPESRGPGLSMTPPASAGTSSASNASCNAAAVTPACLQSLYEIPATSATESSNSILVTGFDSEFARRADLNQFLKRYRPDMSPTMTFTTEKLDGGRNPQNSSSAGLEANLDIQYTIGIATGVPVSFVSVGAEHQDGALWGFLDLINLLLDEDEVPLVMTTSYGNNEAVIPKALAFKLCEAYMALGARGTSILFSSGDGGVEGTQPQKCINYQAAFPVGCPYVTAVGATQGVSPEIGTSFSSGGFSNYWSTPQYQTDAVAGYLKAQGSTNETLFNASGRAYPDVSAQGLNLQIILHGSTWSVYGTSASTPIFASIIALLNDQLLAGNRSPLGFLNPWLYLHPEMFNDITAGRNPGLKPDTPVTPQLGCGTDGFAASTGWDPVTGLGTPNFPKMRAAAGLF
ncbi:family S53 protease [Mycena rosella]|uniref:tripeptidyl-peptidase II n=1 Tax=Mycena rosella TaxID=1033263 RepID=A0AAD7GTL6_MYCRO|nr:family S53 protease [Mycena rosella]